LLIADDVVTVGQVYVAGVMLVGLGILKQEDNGVGGIA
jgi:hypothetical protein